MDISQQNTNIHMPAQIGYIAVQAMCNVCRKYEQTKGQLPEKLCKARSHFSGSTRYGSGRCVLQAGQLS